MLREIVFDTETTGLDAAKGDRLVELGCIEIINRIPTGREFHRYLNPDREVHPEAVAVHGLTNAFLQDKPRFPEVVDAFLEFIGDAPLVAHNGTFDLGFINAEMARVGRPALAGSRIVDTLALARRRHPAGPNTLDALCKRYGIDLSQRTKHGALLDSLLLAGVYVELLGERQATLVFAGAGAQAMARAAAARAAPPAADGRRGGSAPRVRQDTGGGAGVAAVPTPGARGRAGEGERGPVGGSQAAI
jgi:DNA polymerase-3 subunit epsilon